ncbi:MAPEG family protein [Methylobrevis albus]|uniref:MAPEG family protein n=1 Tax=Methylobrevis albus TaxID=2793297 RepID=A0A931I1S6_9HYPH|nr:MAPEG family protein [Methylobrevis albus]MBH0238697.1 MAPEG family protein [Methylobrevis albus]
MEAGALASPLLPLVGWSVVLLIVHVLLQSSAATREFGRAWNAGPRDEALQPKSPLAGRAARASANFRETYPAFLGLALALAVSGEGGGWALVGAWTWFVARLVYIPLYLAGIPYVRSLVWLVAMAGLGIMFLVLVF